jgi:hypothetical protein
VPNLRRVHRGLGEHRDVREQRVEVDLLLVAAAERHPTLLADDRDHGLPVQLRVVQPVQQVDRARPRGRQADPRLPSELRVSAGHEGRHLLVPDLDELQPLACLAPEREHDAVDPVAGVAEHAPHAPFLQASKNEVANRHGGGIPSAAGP